MLKINTQDKNWHQTLRENVQIEVPNLTDAEIAHEREVYDADPTGGQPSRY